MKKPKELSDWDFTDTAPKINGYDVSYIPSATTNNFETIIDEYNNLVEVVNALCEKLGVDFDD